MNPDPGFQSGPGDSAEADSMAPCLLVTKSSPPSGGGSEKLKSMALCTLVTKSDPPFWNGMKRHPLRLMRLIRHSLYICSKCYFIFTLFLGCPQMMRDRALENALSVMAFPRNLRIGLPLRRIGRRGDSRLIPNPNLLLIDSL